MGKKCDICGKDSGMYPLCQEHAHMKQKGFVIKDWNNGKWILKKENFNNLYNNEDDYNDEDDDYYDDEDDEYYDDEQGIEYDNESETCCICGSHAPYGKQCKDCYYETLDYKDNIDKNRKANELREWYFNLKNSIFRQNDYERKQSNCNKLVALAILCRDIHGDDSLISRVYQDIENLLESTSKNIKSVENKVEEYDAHKNESSGQVKCIDGHWVENDLEREIDDILYSLRKTHVYAKKVNEITSRAVKSDWFIPVLSDTKGIYIELWGMDTEEYRRNKEEKIALYQEEELALIQIYRKDVLSDKALLRDNLESWINEKEKELKKRR